MEITKDVLDKIGNLVIDAINMTFEETDDYGELPIASDSFGEIDLVTHSEPEDAIWSRDLQHNFYEGLAVGIRNTLKLIKENPGLIFDNQ